MQTKHQDLLYTEVKVSNPNKRGGVHHATSLARYREDDGQLSSSLMYSTLPLPQHRNQSYHSTSSQQKIALASGKSSTSISPTDPSSYHHFTGIRNNAFSQSPTYDYSRATTSSGGGSSAKNNNPLIPDDPLVASSSSRMDYAENMASTTSYHDMQDAYQPAGYSMSQPRTLTCYGTLDRKSAAVKTKNIAYGSKVVEDFLASSQESAV